MALTADELAWVRTEVGESPSDSDLNAAHDRLGSAVAVVREVLKRRLADRRANPASFTIPGDYSETWSAEQLKGLEAQIAALGPDADDPRGPSMGQLVRSDPAR